jgi:rod shape-determining protein MreB
MTGIPKVIKISYSEIAFAIDKSVSKIEESVLKALEISPPELSADIYDNGIHLTGGGALLRGLDKRLALKDKTALAYCRRSVEGRCSGNWSCIEKPESA